MLILPVALGLLPASPAGATVPGANGKIVFFSDRDGNGEIYAMQANGAGQTPLTSNAAYDHYPAWSPDGTRLAFTSNRDGNLEIHAMLANGTGVTNLSGNAAADIQSSWSPDGTRIAFVSYRDGNAEVYVMNANGTGQNRLTNGPADDFEPAWSPDGTRIAFVSSREGNYEVYVMNADGTSQTRLTTSAGTDGEPNWSPDGSKIAFYSERDGDYEIYTMNANGSSQIRRTSNTASEFHPSWSPDGGRIAFSSDRDGNAEIYLMNTDGSGQVRLTNNAASDFAPDWQRVAGPTAVVRGFEGTSSLDVCALGQCFRPPTPSGAIGITQFLEANNGSVAVYNKVTGDLVQRTAMPVFWTNVGLPGGALGDHRVLFDHFTSRWIISSFGPTANTRNLAISDSSDALGTWKSVRITVLAPGSTADAGTLSLDEKAVYIATNNFNPGFVGTSLLVIPKADLFTGAPTLANMTTFDTPFPAGPDNGFLVQVATNWQANPASSAAVIAASRDTNDLVFYRLNGVGASGATQTPAAVIPGSAYSIVTLDRARQSDGTRLVQLVGGSITANAVKRDGLVFAAQTVRSTLGDFAAVRWTVVDAVTGALRSSGLIQQAGYDFYQGTIAINATGEVVIAYNRSGIAAIDGDADGLPDGNISLMARTYYVDVDTLVPTGSELKLRVSGISDYRCGARTTLDTACVQRWGYWAALSVDPVNPRRFYALGAYASQWAPLPPANTLLRAIWNTYIAEIEAPSSSDTDADGVRDFADNCTLVANPTQCDSDGDGYGNHCDGDFNNNTFTNAQDYVLFRAQLGQPSVGPTYNVGDLNCNGFVNSQDYVLFRGRLGNSTGPSGLQP